MTERSPDRSSRSDGTEAGGRSSARAQALSRRRFVATTALAGVGLFAGCSGGPGTETDDGDGDGQDGSALDITTFRGSGALVEGRPAPGGTSIDDLPDLEGELNFYLGGGEGGLYLELVRLFEQYYPDFSFNHTLAASRTLANTIIEESKAGTSPADVFIAVDAGSLGAVANEGAAVDLPSSVTETVPASYRTNRWVGVAGRARAVPYNTEALAPEDVPDTVQDFPETAAFEDALGWAPTYGAFQSFVTAMRLLRGESATRAWLNGMLDHGVSEFPDEWRVSNAVADGSIRAGFANHYYAMRVKNQRPDAPLELAFTRNDAGALVNVSGAEIIQGTDDRELAETFVRHLLSAEAQEFFATRTFAYPTVPEVQPVGGLPTIDELNPPDIDLAELADTQPTIDLLRETGVL
jgi:iron(III) transport system substrate-binding protein